MIYPIVRLYSSAQSAADVVHKLHAEEFHPDVVDVITAASHPTDDALVSAIAAGYVLRAHAQIYARGVRRGGALVIVRAPFGWGRFAEEILDSYGPIDSGVVPHRDPGPAWDEATPLSCALQLPLLAKGRVGFSSFWNLPELTRTGRTLCSALNLPEISRSAASLSRSLGLPLLSHRAAPLSSRLGLPLLRS